MTNIIPEYYTTDEITTINGKTDIIFSVPTNGNYISMKEDGCFSLLTQSDMNLSLMQVDNGRLPLHYLSPLNISFPYGYSISFYNPEEMPCYLYLSCKSNPFYSINEENTVDSIKYNRLDFTIWIDPTAMRKFSKFTINKHESVIDFSIIKLWCCKDIGVPNISLIKNDYIFENFLEHF